jgi:hypothetical protein
MLSERSEVSRPYAEPERASNAFIGLRALARIGSNLQPVIADHRASGGGLEVDRQAQSGQILLATLKLKFTFTKPDSVGTSLYTLVSSSFFAFLLFARIHAGNPFIDRPD